MLKTALKVIEGKHSGKTIPLEKGNFVIGRESDCNLRPNSEMISRHHCVFKTDEYTVRLRDLGSTNGTFVNGERIQGVTILKDGDTVHIGKLAFQVAISQATTDSVETKAIAAHETSVQVPSVTPSALDDSSVQNVGGGTTIISTVPIPQEGAERGQIPYPPQPAVAQPQQATPAQPIPVQQPSSDSSQPVSRIPAPPIKLPPPPGAE
ncbi:hypothetical protein MNBD_PLANCTO02-827 [hydrothermal vent metagenome]|uniref:FHA domain-containing protein n=1 Tax=hydrothermal vent metagenome TaxID=652676 RepID=A0A3B1E0I7_9ZZZZ